MVGRWERPRASLSESSGWQLEKALYVAENSARVFRFVSVIFDRIMNVGVRMSNHAVTAFSAFDKNLKTRIVVAQLSDQLSIVAGHPDNAVNASLVFLGRGSVTIF